MQAFCYPACWLYEPGKHRNIFANIVKVLMLYLLVNKIIQYNNVT